MPKIEVDVKELIEFIQCCAHADGDGDCCNMCWVCPVRKECDYYFTRSGESGALAGVDLDQ
jgi:hypothetical protein